MNVNEKQNPATYLTLKWNYIPSGDPIAQPQVSFSPLLSLEPLLNALEREVRFGADRLMSRTTKRENGIRNFGEHRDIRERQGESVDKHDTKQKRFRAGSQKLFPVPCPPPRARLKHT